MSESQMESSTSASAADDLFDQGLALFQRRSHAEAKDCFQAANDAEPDHARSRSYLGVCIAISERRFEEAIALCTSASKQEFFNPEVYLNLARVYLHFGFKAEGRRYLLRGQMIDPANEELHQALVNLGQRVEPVLRFLPRRHLVNRLLGTAKHVLVGPQHSQEAA